MFYFHIEIFEPSTWWRNNWQAKSDVFERGACTVHAYTYLFLNNATCVSQLADLPSADDVVSIRKFVDMPTELQNSIRYCLDAAIALNASLMTLVQVRLCNSYPIALQLHWYCTEREGPLALCSTKLESPLSHAEDTCLREKLICCMAEGISFC